MKYNVTVSDASDCYYTEIIVEADTPEAAGKIAIERISAAPNDHQWSSYGEGADFARFSVEEVEPIEEEAV